jgi:superfamily I DNA and/or RNA helicase
MDSSHHFANLSQLIELERTAEAQRAAERKRRMRPAAAEAAGETLIDLLLVEQEPGLGNRFLLRFVKKGGGPLPWTRLDVGSPVVLTPQGEATDQWTRGVVSRRRAESIEVAIADLPEELDASSWRLDLSYDEIALNRQQKALRQAREATSGRIAQLRDVLLNLREPKLGTTATVSPANPDLNPSQLEAITFALAARDIAIIHGPPGTGKTTTVAELIQQTVKKGDKVLACAPSNMGVDNLLEKLLRAGVKAVRLGHPARVLPELREHTLDQLVDAHEDVRVARQLVKDALKLLRKADRYTRAKPQPGEKRALRDEAKALFADARRIEQQTVNYLMDSAEVLCVTTSAIDDAILGGRMFQLAVVDEAGQATEPNTWIPILRAERVVLAGDHCQLPPTVISEPAAKGGLAKSLLERLMEIYPQWARQLTVQYRMHEQIMQFSSDEFYTGTLCPHDSVAQHQLRELPGVQSLPLTQHPVEFVDTSGADLVEEEEPDGESRLNPGEARGVVRKVTELLMAGVPASEIAVITPYGAQVRLLRELLRATSVEVDTVDGFQGREKEAVIVSFVRANTRGEIGFLSDVRRINVALTRARRKLILIGEAATLSQHPFYRRLIDYCERIGAYKSVWEEDWQ